MWKNIVLRDRPQMTIWRMRVACWITKAKTHTQYVILTAFSTPTMVTRTLVNVTLRYFTSVFSFIEIEIH